MIEATGLSKRFGATVAVDDLSFTVPPGQVTGFLGPNGAGKSTTMRMILGLDAPTTGSVTVNGRRYRDIDRPLLEVGALLDARAIHGGRSAYDHLRALALSNAIGRSRIDEVLDQVGLRSVAHNRTAGFSLGMAQRLGIAAALLGDLAVLLFDEPVNGLDPEGVVWIRTLLRSLAADGRTVLLSSHLMSEMTLTADRLIVIGRGRLIAETTIGDMLRGGSSRCVRVRSPQAAPLASRLEERGAVVVHEADDTLHVSGVGSDAIGALAAANGWPLRELAERQATLGLAALLAIFLPDQLSAQDRASLDTTRVSLGGIHLSQVAFGVIGVLAITGEYATGTIRVSLAAVPRRRVFLAAKAAAFSMVALAVAVASCVAAYLVFQGALSDDGLRSGITDPGVLRALVGGGLFLALLGLLGLALGAIVRSGAGAIATLLSLLFVPPVLLELLPHSWKTTIGPYVPMQAGSQILSLRDDGSALSPWAGLGVFGLYVLAGIALAFVLINRRDA